MSNYIVIEDASQLDAELKKNHPSYVLYYTATWCGPCRAIAPVFEKLSKDYPTVVFIKIDIDNVQGHPNVRTISSVPKFEFYKNGSKVNEFAGASASSLEAGIKTTL